MGDDKPRVNSNENVSEYEPLTTALLIVYTPRKRYRKRLRKRLQIFYMDFFLKKTY